jgi:hypothetical protein
MIENTREVTERTEMLGENSVLNITGPNFDPVSLSTRKESILKDNKDREGCNIYFLIIYKNLKY